MPDATCPPEDTLRELLEGTLDPTAETVVDEHVSGCPECERRLAAIQPSAAGFVVWQGLLDAPPDGGVSRVIAPTPETPTGIRRFGKYQVEGELGRGGMGVVYRALDTRLNRQVALKVMLQSVTASPAARERFVQEARSAAAIRSEHVVTTFEADEIAGTSYIAFELLEGRSLAAALVTDPRPPVAEVVRVLTHVARGLDAAHRLGFVHRDIKPSNLWLCEPAGPVKVLDFGLTRSPRAADGLTGAGAVLGTPGYLAPEQARGGPTDARADLFSLGVTAYQMLTGRMPFPGDTAAAMLMALADSNPYPVRDHRPDCPAPLVALVHELLSKDPAGRPPSAAEVARRLDVMTRRFDLLRPTPRALRWKWPVIAVALGVLLLAIFGVWVTQRPNPTPVTEPTAAVPTLPANVPAAEARYVLDADDDALTKWAAELPKGFRITRLSRRTGTAERRYEAVAHIDPAGMAWKLLPYHTYDEGRKLGSSEFGGLESAALTVDTDGSRRLVAKPRGGFWLMGTDGKQMARFAEDIKLQGAIPTSISGVGADYYDMHAEPDPDGRDWALLLRTADTALPGILQRYKQLKQSRVVLASGHVEVDTCCCNLVVGSLLPGEEWDYRTGLTVDELRQADAEFRTRGFRLDTLTSKATPTGPRYNATWLLEPPVAELTPTGVEAMTRLRARGYIFNYLRDGARVSTHAADSPPIGPGPLELQFVSFPWQQQPTEADLSDFKLLPPVRSGLSFSLPEERGALASVVTHPTFSSVRWVNWYGARFTEADADALAAMPRLKALDLTETRVTVSDLKRLSAAKLQQLHVRGVTTLSPEAVVTVAKFPDLRNLWLDKTAIGEESLLELSFLQRLTHFRFGGVRSPITDRTVSVAADSWPRLFSLVLLNSRLTANGAASLCKCTRLNTLALTEGSVVRADFVVGLCKAASIKKLSLDGARPLDPDALSALATVKQFEELTLPSDTPEAELKKLELALPKCKVKKGTMP